LRVLAGFSSAELSALATQISQTAYFRAKKMLDGVAPRLAVNAIRIPSTESPHAHREKSPFGLADKTRIYSMHRK